MTHKFNAHLGILLGLFLAPSFVVSPARADLRNPAAWKVLIAHERVAEVVRWDPYLVGTGGGLLLVDPSENSIEAITTTRRLTSNRTTSLAVDATGRLWVGTQNAGVIRVDGSLTPRSISGLLDRNVTAVATDGDFVYYGTPSGGGRIVSELPEFTFTEDDGLLSNEIVALAAHDGLAWFGTELGVSEFSLTSNGFVTRNTGLSPATPAIRDLAANAQGTFCATAAGVFEYDRGAGTWSAAGDGISGDATQLTIDDDALLALVSGSVRRLPFATGVWETISVSVSDFLVSNMVEDADGRVWVAGAELDFAATGTGRVASFWRDGLAEPLSNRGLYGSQPRGIAGDGAGGAWVGTFPPRSGLTRWRSNETVVAYNRTDSGAGDGWCPASVMIAVHRASNEDVWVSSFTNCLTRLRPGPNDDLSAATYDNFTPDNSPIQSDRVIRIGESPEGHLWFMSDGAGAGPFLNYGIDILVDPAAPQLAASWIKVTSTNSLLAGDNVKGVTFGPGGVAWLSLTGAGVQRWNYDGFTDDGQVDPATLSDSFHWDIVDQTDLSVDISDPRGTAITRNGDIWVGTNGQGAVRFRYNNGLTTVVDRVRQTPFGPTLLSGQIRSIQLDRDDNLWCATDAGLNRVTGTGQDLRIDAWTDFEAYFSRNLGGSFSPDIISPLPGSNLQTLAYDAAANTLFVASGTGAAALSIEGLTTVDDSAFDVTVYPNPVRNADDSVRLTDFEGTVNVRIYNLAGVLILENDGIEPGEAVWTTRDFDSELVASGLYVVRIEHSRGVVLKTLAIER